MSCGSTVPTLDARSDSALEGQWRSAALFGVGLGPVTVVSGGSLRWQIAVVELAGVIP